MEAMKDAANLLCRIKTDMNPESSVGVVACGMPLGPKVLCSCSQDMAALLSACANVNIGGGNADFAKALQVSALALKHRRNKNGGQRIVAFVGSPIADDEAKLVKLAKNLKKNNIAVDIVSMGEHEANEPKLKAFMEAVDKNSNSHLVVIPPGVLPSEVMMSSPIITGGEEGGDVGMGGGGGGGGAAAAAFAEYGGVDPSLDPELAMALRASMEEERARMAVASGTTGDSGSVEPGTAFGEAQTPAAASKESAAQGPADDDDEELLRQALLMSMNENPLEPGETNAAQERTGAEDEDEDDDAKALALALAMSKEEEEPAPTGSASSAPSSQAPAGGFLDPSYVNELLEGIEGVNMDDPQIKALLAQYPSSGTKPGDGPDSKKQKKEDEDK
jgi:26S proteasome regulatory subunit N10